MPTNVNLANRLYKQLPTEIAECLRIIGETSAKQGLNIYLVGGAVRDLLLGLSTTDLDIVVEGNAIELAKSLPLKRGKLTVHQAFGTASIKWNHTNIDLATARSEIYTQPGALPEIMPSNINRDLFRRDFTINAIAVSLHKNNFGELLDPYNGVQDLKSKLIRILHSESFIDDATRIWRAIRYEKRLNFKLEGETLRLLKRDIDMLNTISGDRIRHELELVLKEKRPEKALIRAEELKILAKLNLRLTDGKWLEDKYEEAREMGLPDTSLLMIYFALLVYNINSGELTNLSERLNLNRATINALKNTVKLKETLPALSEPLLPASEIYFTLNDYPELSVIANLIATDNATVEKYIDNYLTRLCHIKPRLNGDDLKRLDVPQGPEINKVLHLLHEAKLDGKVITKQGETRLVYNWLREREAKKKK